MTDARPSLIKHPLEGTVAELAPPTRVIYSANEWQEAVREKKTAALNATAKFAMGVDMEENSFAYHYGIRQGYVAKDIVFSAHDGARIDQIPAQLERLYEMKTATLPPLVLLSFNVDICRGDLFDKTIDEHAAFFRQELIDAWSKSAPFLKAHEKGTIFAVVAPLDVKSNLTNPLILEKKIPFQGGEAISCQKMRQIEPTDGFLQEKMKGALIGMCPAILRVSADDHQKISHIAEIQQNLRGAWRDVILNLNEQYQDQGIQWTFIEDVDRISFAAEDVANDCFHPSAKGHSRIATELISRRLENQKSHLTVKVAK